MSFNQTFQVTALEFRWCSSEGCSHTFSRLRQSSLCLELKINDTITRLDMLLEKRFMGEKVDDYKCWDKDERTGCGRLGAGRSARLSNIPDVLILNFQRAYQVTTCYGAAVVTFLHHWTSSCH